MLDRKWPRRGDAVQALLVAVAVFTRSPGEIRGGANFGSSEQVQTSERQITRGRGGRILTNAGVWSPDSRWLVYDTRSDPAGESFDGSTIEMVNVETSEAQMLYRSTNGAHCGVATFDPRQPRVVFILGPEAPTADWQYCAYHRQGVVVEAKPGLAVRRSFRLDARDLRPPFTPGALRGGSHVHVWDAAGQWVSFTYEDHVLAQYKESTAENDINLRNLGVSVPGHQVRVHPDHPRNHDAEFFSVVVTRTTAQPRPGSDEIKKASEEAWVGSQGYLRPDGSRQRHALAFQGQVLTAEAQTISEVFIVDLPEDLTVAGDGPLAGTARRMPSPPKGAHQRRLTYTADRRFPGLQGPRHWLRSAPDGQRIAFLMKDDAGVVQLWTVSPNGGPLRQISHNRWPISSAFTWSPDGQDIAHVMDNSVCLTQIATGQTRRLTPRGDDDRAPLPQACVVSPDGKRIAFVRRVAESGVQFNQIFVVMLED